jgi:hypothetical protein
MVHLQMLPRIQCAVSVQMNGASGMVISAASLNLEPYSGSSLEENLSSLSVAETATDSDLEYTAHISDDLGASVAPQSAEDCCAALSGHATSEHGLFCACIENVASHAAAVCGAVTAAEVWGCAAAAVRARGNVILSCDGPDATDRGFDRERLAIEVHVVARLASRCMHELHACNVDVVLGFAWTMVDWVTRAMQQLAEKGTTAGQQPAMIACVSPLNLPFLAEPMV